MSGLPVNGLAVARSLDLSNTGLLIKAGAGKLYGWRLWSVDTDEVYLKFYDKATAGTSADTPIMTVGISGSDILLTGEDGHPDDFFAMHGIKFELGLSARVVTGLADNDNNDPGTNVVSGNFFYS